MWKCFGLDSLNILHVRKTSLLVFLVGPIWHIVFWNWVCSETFLLLKMSGWVVGRGMISLPRDPIPGREGSVLRKGGKTLGDSSDRQDLANLLHGPFCKHPSCLPKGQPGVPREVFLPWAPPYNWGASVQAVGAMQEGLLRNAGTVSVLEIAAFRN